jgi:hypothetical protein
MELEDEGRDERNQSGGSTLCSRTALTILKASFFLLDEMAIICAS